jgi:hypothetical protein
VYLCCCWQLLPLSLSLTTCRFLSLLFSLDLLFSLK